MKFEKDDKVKIYSGQDIYYGKIIRPYLGDGPIYWVKTAPMLINGNFKDEFIFHERQMRKLVKKIKLCEHPFAKVYLSHKTGTYTCDLCGEKFEGPIHIEDIKI